MAPHIQRCVETARSEAHGGQAYRVVSVRVGDFERTSMDDELLASDTLHLDAQYVPKMYGIPDTSTRALCRPGCHPTNSQQTAAKLGSKREL